MSNKFTRFGTIILTAAAAAAVLGACSKPATVDNGADPAPSSSSQDPSPGTSSEAPGDGTPGRGNPSHPDGTTFVALTRSNQNLPNGAPNGPGTVVITADGAWAFTPKSGPAKNGTLTAAQLADLNRLVADPAISGSTDKSKCPADTPTYMLTLPGQALTGTCGTKRNAVFTEVVDLILAATAI
ncbi:hypothetical protein [Phytomonospora endophytica]|uniref:DUF3558 domain-containing protein n=1 Tax=Phytomonospora endophytica TaxID=714109 RepID=A0A841FU18_9ACTN|nr:hypothetical protein [Phytomonospora endophytica]MBB6037042.1 hypothetical protein [Phytomonospora endophytica]GIG69414.1 hypothetical protein Pen01_57090 [Phytomonospora endophytica]